MTPRAWWSPQVPGLWGSFPAPWCFCRCRHAPQCSQCGWSSVSCFLLPLALELGYWGPQLCSGPVGRVGSARLHARLGTDRGRCFCPYSRLVAWLPDVPADLQWMQGLLRSLALEVYSRTKDQLLRLVG